MTNPFKKVQPGEPVQQSARLHNMITDLAKVSNVKHVNTTRDRSFEISSSVVKIIHETNSGPRFGPIGIDGPLCDPADDEDKFKRVHRDEGLLVLTGSTPDEETHSNKFAIALEPFVTGRPVRAIVSGLTVANVLVPTPEEGEDIEIPDRVDIEDGNLSYLIGSTEGAARVISCPEATGVQLALIDLGGGSGSGEVYAEFTTTADPEGEGYPSKESEPNVYYATKKKIDGFTKEEGSQTITTTLDGGDYIMNLGDKYLKSGTVVRCIKAGGQWFCEIWKDEVRDDPENTEESSLKRGTLGDNLAAGGSATFTPFDGSDPFTVEEGLGMETGASIPSGTNGWAGREGDTWYLISAGCS